MTLIQIYEIILSQLREIRLHITGSQSLVLLLVLDSTPLILKRMQL